eukprot:363759-Chlamydomonas_euryale.AAC.22
MPQSPVINFDVMPTHYSSAFACERNDSGFLHYDYISELQTYIGSRSDAHLLYRESFHPSIVHRKCPAPKHV